MNNLKIVDHKGKKVDVINSDKILKLINEQMSHIGLDIEGYTIKIRELSVSTCDFDIMFWYTTKHAKWIYRGTMANCIGIYSFVVFPQLVDCCPIKS